MMSFLIRRFAFFIRLFSIWCRRNNSRKMIHCFRCCDKCCTSCNKCCNECCSGIEKCCGSCCNAINECFKTPFSLCATLTGVFVLGPAVAGVITLSNNEPASTFCDKPLVSHLVVMAAMHLVNFLFAIYLFCKFRKPYDRTQSDGQVIKNSIYDAPKETDICKRLTVLLCYDFVVVFYILALLFGFVWAIIGHSWLGSSSQLCKNTCPNLISWVYVLIIVFWVYVGLGIAIFLLTICIQACEEGSCGCEYVCGCCISCCTCGLCGSSMMKSSKEKRITSVD